MKKQALLIGLGVSGQSAAKFLLSLGYQVYGVDEKKEKCEESFHLGVLKAPLDLKEIDLVVLSPGVSPSDFWVQKAIEEKKEVIGEAELALRHLNQKAVGITGTNGKTTVTLLVEHILISSGRKAKALGNVGTALSGYVGEADLDEIAVIELSSYQIDTLYAQKLDAALILNITPDHLDRYKTMENYAQSKANIERCLKPDGALFLFEEIALKYGSLFSRPFLSFGSDLSSHDEVNVQAAFLLCSYLGVKEEEFLSGLKTFKKPSHRIELVRKLRGVSYYDDSKGTNIDAVIKAVHSMDGQTILIAGGVDKGASYLPWKESLQGRVKQMFLIGQSALKIQQELGLFFNVQIVDSLADAVQLAFYAASPGECVLLSPGCSSFDMFRDYAHRGKEFQRFVCLLEEGDKNEP